MASDSSFRKGFNDRSCTNLLKHIDAYFSYKLFVLNEMRKFYEFEPNDPSDLETLVI